MRTWTGLSLAVVAAVLLPAALAFGHGGGGGGGGHGGGGGGGGHGGGGGFGGHSSFGGGSYHSGGMSAPSMMRSSGGLSSGSMRSGTISGNSFNGATHTGIGNNNFSAGTHANHNSFVKGNFTNSAATGAMQHQVNRINSGTANHALGNNSFVRSQNVTGTGANHWTHNGNWNHNNNWNHNGNWNHNHNSNFFFFPGFGFGLWGLYGYGWPWGYGYGYGYPLYGYNYYGYGAYPGYGYSYAAAPLNPTVAADDASAGNFTEQGEINFKAGKYQAAMRDWQHSLVDDPKNGGVMLLMAQTLFALGQYDDAAGATQAAMQMLPEDKWGVIGSNYAQLYGNIQDYTDQLKALEKARDAKPDSPALHFLLGFHFGYVGYPKHAVKELDKTLTLAPKDLGARKLRDIFAAKWPEAPPLPAAAVEAAKEAEKGGPQKPRDATPAEGDGTPS